MADVSAILDTIIVDEGPARLSAALLRGRCLSNVVGCHAWHPRAGSVARSRGPSEAERNDDKVPSKAADATLKTIAATALPLIKTHLQASQDEMKDVG